MMLLGVDDVSGSRRATSGVMTIAFDDDVVGSMCEASVTGALASILLSIHSFDISVLSMSIVKNIAQII